MHSIRALDFPYSRRIDIRRHVLDALENQIYYLLYLIKPECPMVNKSTAIFEFHQAVQTLAQQAIQTPMSLVYMQDSFKELTTTGAQ